MGGVSSFSWKLFVVYFLCSTLVVALIEMVEERQFVTEKEKACVVRLARK